MKIAGGQLEQRDYHLGGYSPGKESGARRKGMEVEALLADEFSKRQRQGPSLPTARSCAGRVGTENQ